jgi:hypothetical protein
LGKATTDAHGQFRLAGVTADQRYIYDRLPQPGPWTESIRALRRTDPATHGDWGANAGMDVPAKTEPSRIRMEYGVGQHCGCRYIIRAGHGACWYSWTAESISSMNLQTSDLRWVEPVDPVGAGMPGPPLLALGVKGSQVQILSSRRCDQRVRRQRRTR